jgi:hypothetical protein
LLVQLKLALAIIIFRELVHHLAKIWFAMELTPPGIVSNSIVGEAGLALENKLFGGVIWRSLAYTRCRRANEDTGASS